MEKLIDKYEHLTQIKEACQRAVHLYKNQRIDATRAEKEAAVASVIKHGELFYEVLWKFLKHYLMYNYGTDVAGSKTIFRACYAQKFLDEDELTRLIEITERRNLSAHVYSNDLAKRICDAISDDFEVMKAVVERIILDQTNK